MKKLVRDCQCTDRGLLDEKPRYAKCWQRDGQIDMIVTSDGIVAPGLLLLRYLSYISEACVVEWNRQYCLDWIRCWIEDHGQT